MLFDLKQFSHCLKLPQLKLGLETYFQMKETASQSDEADRRYTGLKLGVLNRVLNRLEEEEGGGDVVRDFVTRLMRPKYLLKN